MRNIKAYLWLPLTGAVLFNFVFWQEKLGVNLALFDLFILVALAYLYDFSSTPRVMRSLIAANLFCLSMVLFQNSDTSKIGLWLTLLLLIAFAQFKHRSAWFAAASIIMNFMVLIPTLFQTWQALKGSGKSSSRVGRTIRLLIWPFVISFLFFCIYLASSDIFAYWISSILDAFDPLITWMESFVDLGRLIFLGLGFYFVAAMLLRNNLVNFSKADVMSETKLIRVRPTRIKTLAGQVYTGWPLMKRKMLALKNMNTVGLISLALLNALLFIINGIDVAYLWLGVPNTAPSYLSHDVHSGTGSLIFSIVLAMIIILIFFRGNLNFYSKNKWFKNAAYLWIIQNGFLVLSLFLRDYYYISHFGLTPKRIGVMYFLIFVIIGLITVFIKLKYKRSLYYLFSMNAWSAVCILVLSTAINWDKAIVNYNLSNRASIGVDWPFLLSLSDKTLPELEKHRTEISHLDDYQHGSLIKVLEMREKNFLQSQRKYSWLSWNYADARVKGQLSASMSTPLSRN